MNPFLMVLLRNNPQKVPAPVPGMPRLHRDKGKAKRVLHFEFVSGCLYQMQLKMTYFKSPSIPLYERGKDVPPLAKGGRGDFPHLLRRCTSVSKAAIIN